MFRRQWEDVASTHGAVVDKKKGKGEGKAFLVLVSGIPGSGKTSFGKYVCRLYREE